VAEKFMPQAEIVADRFPVMKQVNEELEREKNSNKEKKFRKKTPRKTRKFYRD
jgi:transposase